VRNVCAALLSLPLSACSPTSVLNAMAPHGSVTVTRDVAYADGARRTLDVYAPRASAAASPVVVFFYGGGWETGSKDMYRFVGATLAARGVMTVIPDYRLYPRVRFPAFMRDAAEAVAWTRSNAVRFGGDADRLFLMGHSAGGQIAALLALDGSYLKANGMSSSDLCGVIGLAGPYDFLPLRSDTLKAIFGPDAERPRSQPINYVSPRAPPMLLLAGRDDDTVDPGNTLRLAARLRDVGRPVDDTLYPGVGHKTLIASFSVPLTFLAPAREATLRFISARGACAGR
jgi:acetyl esterase/lipase